MKNKFRGCKLLLVIIVLFLFSIKSFSQIFLPNPILSKWTDDRLLLRWEPASVKEWHDAFEHGYKIEVYDALNPTVSLNQLIVQVSSSNSFVEMTNVADPQLKDLYSTCHALNYPKELAAHDIIEL